MRILFASDPPTAVSSYGIQTRQIVPVLKAAGHEVIVYGLTSFGEMLNMGGIDVLGGNGDVHGLAMGAYAERFKCDILVTFKDPYVFDTNALRALRVPWVPIVPIDTEPVCAHIMTQLTFATAVCAICPNGVKLLEEQGIGAFYTPLGIDTQFWTPGDKDAARQKLGLPQEAFIAAFVGANQTQPSRKSIDQIILAWGDFLELCPDQRDAVLYFHTDMNGSMGGLWMEGVLDAAGVARANWRASDQLAYMGGFIGPEHLRDIYRAADVLLNPSMGGGFELTMLEAQACGTPVISTQWTAMRDMNWSGWQIAEKTGGEPFLTPLGGFFLRPHRRAIVQCLMMAAAKRGDARIATAAREGAWTYDIRRVMADHWIPAFGEIEGLLKEARLRAGI